MIIRWLGQACIVIKQPTAALVMDPYGDGVGFRLPKLEASVVTVSHDHFDHNNARAVGGSPFIVNEPGDYEVAGFSIEAIPSFHDTQKGAKRGENLIVKVTTQEFSLAHFGDLGQEELTPVELDALGDVDIAFIPVGGFYTIGGKEAAKIVNRLEPKVAVPIHYQIPKLAIKDLAGPEEFFKQLEQSPTVIEGDWKVKVTDLPQEGTRVVQLLPQHK